MFTITDPNSGILNNEMSLFGLKIFRKLIEIENKELSTPASDWNNDEFEQYIK